MAAPTDPWRTTLARLWTKQSQWSAAANNYKKAHRSWNGPLIAIGFLGVVISTVSPHLVAKTATTPDEWTVLQYVLAVAGPVIVAVAALLTREILGPKSEHKWIKAREISESLKSEGFIFAVGAPPYSDPKTAPRLLAAKMNELAPAAGPDGLGPLPAATVNGPRTDEPASSKKPPGPKPHEPLTLDEYIDRRVNAQCTYHDGEARRFAGALARWQGVAIALMAVSAALGIIAGFGKQASFNVWVAVVSTALATVTAYVTASRLEFLAATYAATSERLQSLVTNWQAKDNTAAAERDRFILDCEAVLAAQNRTWADELSKRVIDRINAARPPGAPPSGEPPPAAPPPAAPPPATPPPGPAGEPGG
ncbi:MAG TPA: DUF4231 domain-containing protein [Kofleriaceae bacterium]|jgi:hypothetical protein|nr:DUF4231 domain-containing protein [Kofleriaceae bacterium]